MRRFVLNQVATETRYHYQLSRVETTNRPVWKQRIVLFGSEFWNGVCDFDALVKWGTISPEDVGLFKIVDTVEEAHDYIVDCLTKRFLS